MIRVWIGLGSNLDNPLSQLQNAVAALRELPETHVVAVSPVYRNPALLPPGAPPASQPDYLNAVACADTLLSPQALLIRLQAIENTQRRTREQRWGARTLDLDLLLYGDTVLATEMLTIPHPGMRDRLFVLQPLFDLAPELVMPDGCPLADALAACPATTLERIAADAC